MNRRQRRAQATAKSDLASADDIPMAMPSRGQPRTKAKTLFEIAAEKQAQLRPHDKPFAAPGPGNVVQVRVDADGNLVEERKDGQRVDDTAPLSPILDTLFFAFSLSALHFTLEVLTVHQYAQELKFAPIFFNTIFVAFPTLTLIVHFFHGHLVSLPIKLTENMEDRMYALRQLIFVIIANIAGCYLIQVTNDRGYYAVMKKAPSIGTVWVWSVIELGLAGALAGVVGPGIFAWYYGYGIF
jgi:hypothetical protein